MSTPYNQYRAVTTAIYLHGHVRVGSAVDTTDIDPDDFTVDPKLPPNGWTVVRRPEPKPKPQPAVYGYNRMGGRTGPLLRALLAVGGGLHDDSAGDTRMSDDAFLASLPRVGTLTGRTSSLRQNHANQPRDSVDLATLEARAVEIAVCTPERKHIDNVEELEQALTRGVVDAHAFGLDKAMERFSERHGLPQQPPKKSVVGVPSGRLGFSRALPVGVAAAALQVLHEQPTEPDEKG